MTILLALVMGGVVGLTLGVFGSGGSVLAVPILVYVLGMEVKDAIAMSLVIVGLTAVTGAVQQYRQKTFCLKPALFFSAVGIVGAYVGTWLAMLASPVLQLFIFGIVMVVAAIATMLKKEPDVESGGD
ncbi:MAG: sulfite exporter TauE/SafE family protein, partial [bacterium]|nr:sulfite exporter TauE/SafE family protein [bacterium]